MLPAVLEIHVVWHPDDETKARPIADAIIDHYHGDQFSGLIGGAIEVCVRSAGWTGPGSAPRPILLPGDAGPPQPAAHVAVVALLGNGLGRALSWAPADPWHAWLARLKDAVTAMPDKVCLRAMALDHGIQSVAPLAPLFGSTQLLGQPDPQNPPDDTMLLRDLSQSLAQFIEGGNHPIQVFVSHTKHTDDLTEAAVKSFVDAVRLEIRHSRLREFFDSHSIQAGDEWAKKLEANAGTGAMLSLRTDRYSGREWCHREVAIAKRRGVPVVAIDALIEGDDRGSFLLNHVPRVPAVRSGVNWDPGTIRKALARLVDECLKRALWKRQCALAGSVIFWWSAHAPEPLTFTAWLRDNRPTGRGPLIVLHPDPPLTATERAVIDDIAALGGLGKRLEVLTPRTLAARAGAVLPRRKRKKT